MIFYQKQYDALYTYHSDAQGNIVAISGEDGTILEKYAYDVYGRLTSATAWNGSATVSVVDGDFDGDGYIDGGATADGFFDKEYFARSAIGNEILFQGRRYDQESGLYYFRNRYYDPETGRFISRDPSGPVDGPNLYAFVNNNPINYVDPFGLESELPDYIEIDEKRYWKPDHTLTDEEKARGDVVIPKGEFRGQKDMSWETIYKILENAIDLSYAGAVYDKAGINDYDAIILAQSFAFNKARGLNPWDAEWVEPRLIKSIMLMESNCKGNDPMQATHAGDPTKDKEKYPGLYGADINAKIHDSIAVFFDKYAHHTKQVTVEETGSDGKPHNTTQTVVEFLGWEKAIWRWNANTFAYHFITKNGKFVCTHADRYMEIVKDLWQKGRNEYVPNSWKRSGEQRLGSLDWSLQVKIMKGLLADGSPFYTTLYRKMNSGKIQYVDWSKDNPQKPK